MGTQKNRLNETVRLSSQNICLKLWVRKYLQVYAEIFCLFKPMGTQWFAYALQAFLSQRETEKVTKTSMVLNAALQDMCKQTWAATCDFQQRGILTSVDSEEPVQPPFKLRNSKWCSVSSLTLVEYSSN